MNKNKIKSTNDKLKIKPDNWSDGVLTSIFENILFDMI